MNLVHIILSEYQKYEFELISHFLKPTHTRVSSRLSVKIVQIVTQNSWKEYCNNFKYRSQEIDNHYEEQSQHFCRTYLVP